MWKYILLGLGMFGFIYMLIPLHNWYYGGKIVFTTTSSTIVENIPFSFKFWKEKLSDGEFFGFFITLVKQLLFIDPKIISIINWPILYSNLMKFPLIIYIISFIYNLSLLIYKKSTIYMVNLLLLIIPIAFLVPHFFYQVGTYYPRLIIQGQITIYIFSLITAIWIDDMSNFLFKFYKKLKTYIWKL